VPAPPWGATVAPAHISLGGCVVSSVSTSKFRATFG